LEEECRSYSLQSYYPMGPSNHFLLFSLIKVTPSLPYRSLSPGRSSKTTFESKCFFSKAKNLLSA